MNPDDDLITGLRAAVEDVVRAVTAGARRVAVVDFPGYANVGDSAIWLGQLAALRAAGVRRLRYTCDLKTYDAGHMARRVGDGTILLSGGGSFGDLWEKHQRWREDIVRAFPDNPIVLLPQSLFFRRRASLDRARSVFGAHANLTLLLRDRRSLEVAGNEFPNPVRLCPDMAFALGALPRPLSPGEPAVWLCRADREAVAGVTAANAPGPLADWAREEDTALIAAVRAASWRLARRRRALRLCRRALSAAYPRLARQRLARGVRLVSRARVVVTDRLHGHVLCLLLGIPHVVMDNSYGKIGAFRDTWTSGAALTRWAASVSEARSHVEAMVADPVT